MLSGRRGFTLVEIVIALAIIGLLAGVMIPQLFRRADDAESSAMLQNISSVVTAITGFRADVGRYPSSLVLLTSAPSAASVDLCGRTMPGYAQWSGPYLDRSLTSAGLATGSAEISNDLSRNPPSNQIVTTVADLVITATEVEQEVALALQAQLDGDASLASGSVRWSLPAGVTGTRGTMTYRMPIRGC